jgi:hypothetical protein
MADFGKERILPHCVMMCRFSFPCLIGKEYFYVNSSRGGAERQCRGRRVGKGEEGSLREKRCSYLTGRQLSRVDFCICLWYLVKRW